MVLSPVYIYDLACIFNLCVYVCVFMYSRTIAHVELMFLLIKPTLNKVYFTLLSKMDSFAPLTPSKPIG